MGLFLFEESLKLSGVRKQLLTIAKTTDFAVGESQSKGGIWVKILGGLGGQRGLGDLGIGLFQGLGDFVFVAFAKLTRLVIDSPGQLNHRVLAGFELGRRQGGQLLTLGGVLQCGPGHQLVRPFTGGLALQDFLHGGVLGPQQLQRQSQGVGQLDLLELRIDGRGRKEILL